MASLLSAVVAALLLAMPAPKPGCQHGFTLAQDDLCAVQPELCPCNRLPGCPDGATPVGQQGFCTCPRPTACPVATHVWQCTFFRTGDSFNPGGWECGCEFVGRPEPEPIPNPPIDPPGGLCTGLLCSDGSTPRSDGFSCLCPG